MTKRKNRKTIEQALKKIARDAKTGRFAMGGSGRSSNAVKVVEVRTGKYKKIQTSKSPKKAS